MGFMDELKKAASSVKEQLEQSGMIDRAREAAPQAAPAAAQQPWQPQDVWGCGSGDPLRWISQADVAAITGVPVGPGVPTETAETWGVAFEGTDARGQFRFEVHAANEDVIGAYQGCARWIDAHAATHERHTPVATFGDYTVVAADGDSHNLFFAWVADACFYAEAHTPGLDMARALEGILRRIFDWPE